MRIIFAKALYIRRTNERADLFMFLGAIILFKRHYEIALPNEMHGYMSMIFGFAN